MPLAGAVVDARHPLAARVLPGRCFQCVSLGWDGPRNAAVLHTGVSFFLEPAPKCR